MSEVSDVAEDDWQLWRTFVTMRHELDRAIEHRLQADAGISGADFEILLSLFKAQDGRLRARELGELLGWEKSRISHQVTRMVARGLVERQECGTDLRGTWVVLRPEGRRAVLKASRGNAAELRRQTAGLIASLRRLFFDVLTAGEKEALGSVSGKVIDAINPAVCRRNDEILGATSEEPAAS
jgi:DNA-binding MarR family transcriptional regulator